MTFPRPRAELRLAFILLLSLARSRRHVYSAAPFCCRGKRSVLLARSVISFDFSVEVRNTVWVSLGGPTCWIGLDLHHCRDVEWSGTSENERVLHSCCLLTAKISLLTAAVWMPAFLKYAKRWLWFNSIVYALFCSLTKKKRKLISAWHAVISIHSYTESINRVRPAVALSVLPVSSSEMRKVHPALPPCRVLRHHCP